MQTIVCETAVMPPFQGLSGFGFASQGVALRFSIPALQAEQAKPKLWLTGMQNITLWKGIPLRLISREAHGRAVDVTFPNHLEGGADAQLAPAIPAPGGPLSPGAAGLR
jgi:hypothetical protein